MKGGVRIQDQARALWDPVSANPLTTRRRKSRLACHCRRIHPERLIDNGLEDWQFEDAGEGDIGFVREGGEDVVNDLGMPVRILQEEVHGSGEQRGGGFAAGGGEGGGISVDLPARDAAFFCVFAMFGEIGDEIWAGGFGVETLFRALHGPFVMAYPGFAGLFGDEMSKEAVEGWEAERDGKEDEVLEATHERFHPGVVGFVGQAVEGAAEG